ncbi:tRNA-specific 2-thiouridylase MnmA, partial [Bienertia sinuspersici]
AEGKVEVWSGSIRPHDVWLIKRGFRFEVCFNRHYQPIRKGGAVLVKFVADIAKRSDLCSIGVVNWRNLNKQVQADIVELIRHVGKHRQQWKFELKPRYLNPTVRTRQQIENDNPGGIIREKYELCLVIFIEMVPQAMLIQEMNLRWNMEESQRSDVMGVHTLLWKKGIASEMNNDNNDLKVKFARHQKETADFIMRLSSSVIDLLTAVQSGRISPETLAATNSAFTHHSCS